MSVIVPVYNREAVIEKCLKGIRASVHKDYELIVVDCASTDKTLSIAKSYADILISLQDKAERFQARSRGVADSKGEIIVNIDSDVLIRPDTLALIDEYFSENPYIGALTGCLAKDSHCPCFFSQYKNLYMHYIFKRLPREVTFLYGSIYAFRRTVWQDYDSYVKIADDTALGQQFVSRGIKISFLKELEVVHLKKYNLGSFISNDFLVPFDWAGIFLKSNGWKQLGRNKTGFAHASKGQLVSVVLAPVIFILLSAGMLANSYLYTGLLMVLAWFFLNLRFFKFIAQEKGFIFAASAVFITFLDNLIMLSGIICGLFSYLITRQLFAKRISVWL
jgi:glycosyltransferase involved in cell wall biosynthesis